MKMDGRKVKTVLLWILIFFVFVGREVPSWPPSWILPRIRNQVKTARNGNFFVLDMSNNA